YFVGSSTPDVWNSAAAIATMAATNSLAAIPRNGLTSSLQRQVDLAKEVFEWIDFIAEDILENRSDKNNVKKRWKKNVMGTVDAEADEVLERTEKLYEVGVRTFRIYSPEPSIGPVEATKV